MGVFNTATTTEFMLPDENRYRARVSKFEEAPDVGYGTGVYWFFNLAPKTSPEEFLYDDNGNLYELRQRTSATVSPNSTAGKWIATLRGRGVQDGERINDGELVGLSFEILLIHETKGEGDNARTYANISKESAPKPWAGDGQAKPAPAPQAATNGTPSASREQLLKKYVDGVKKAAALKVDIDEHFIFDTDEASEDEIKTSIRGIAEAIRNAAASAAA